MISCRGRGFSTGRRSSAIWASALTPRRRVPRAPGASHVSTRATPYVFLRSCQQCGRSMPLPRIHHLCPSTNFFQKCPSYPEVFAVPATVEDVVVEQVMKFRAHGRLPVVSYIHPVSKVGETILFFGLPGSWYPLAVLTDNLSLARRCLSFAGRSRRAASAMRMSSFCATSATRATAKRRLSWTLALNPRPRPCAAQR